MCYWFLCYNRSLYNNSCYIVRRRVLKGTLVASTNKFTAIRARRLIVEVLYNFRNGVVKEKVIDVREKIEQ